VVAPALGVVEDVLVVAGDEERPRLRAQLPQRLGVRAELLDRAIHQVADDRHQGRPRVVDLTHDFGHVPAVDQRAEVDVGEHRDREAVQPGIEPVQQHLATFQPQ